MIIVLVGGATTTITPSDSGEIAPAFSDESPAPVQVADILPLLYGMSFLKSKGETTVVDWCRV